MAYQARNLTASTAGRPAPALGRLQRRSPLRTRALTSGLSGAGSRSAITSRPWLSSRLVHARYRKSWHVIVGQAFLTTGRRCTHPLLWGVRRWTLASRPKSQGAHRRGLSRDHPPVAHRRVTPH